MRTLIVIPTYDEAMNIEPLIDRTRAVAEQCDLLVVDDGSPDGTAELVARRASWDQHVHLMRRRSKAGLGAAYRAGFGWGVDRGYDVLIEMDADLSHPPERIPALLAALDHADVAIGSRYVSGGATVGWPASRLLISRLGNAYASMSLRLGVSDATAGFRAYRRDVLEAIDIRELRSNGYCFQIEMTDRTRHAGFRIAEIPITFTERLHGRSKMRATIAIEAVSLMTVWGVRHWLCGRRLRPQRIPLSSGLTITTERLHEDAA